MSDYTSKTIQSKKVKTLRRVGLIFVGLALGYFTGFLIKVFFISPLDLHETSEKIINFGVYTISVGYIFVGGYRQVKQAYVGVPSFFGERSQIHVFTEGHTWLPPRPFMDMDMLSVEVDLKNITAASITTSDMQKLTVTGSVIYRIEDPYLFLNNTQEVRTHLLQKLLESSIRGQTITDRLSNTDLLTVDNEFGDAVRRNASMISSEFGIEIKNIFLVHVSGSQKLMNTYEDLYIKLQIKFMEIVNKRMDYKFYYDIFKDLVKEDFIKNNFTGKDITTFLLLYMGKIERKDYNFGVDANENIVKAIKDLLEYYKISQ